MQRKAGRVVVTGAAGFIGRRTAEVLRDRGYEVVPVDLPGHGMLTHEELLAELGRAPVHAVVHQGAVSDTLADDLQRLWALNYEYSRRLYERCHQYGIPLVYASSAAVYGSSLGFEESPANEHPLNEYAKTKLAFDAYVREQPRGLACGLRYFNVYGPGEDHKGGMASVILQAFDSLAATGVFRLFEGSHGFPAGEQRRDFVHVDDVVAVVEFFVASPKPGIYNVGTGVARTFNDVVRLVIEARGEGRLEYRPMPARVAEAYQAHTCASLVRLRASGYAGTFRPIERGVGQYVEWLKRVRATRAS